MIRLVKRTHLNEDKYNFCISNSLQSRVYAFSWYLDVVADNWSVLVLDDYAAVMPLPWKRKFLLKYITQPFFTQQLGIFSLGEIREKGIQNFIDSIPIKYIKIGLQFNSDNLLNDKFFIRKQNYILQLNSDYNTLKSKFSKGRKSAILKGEKLGLTISKINIVDLLDLSKKHYEFKELNLSDYQKLINLTQDVSNHIDIEVIGVLKDGTLEGGAVFLIDKYRITYLFSAVSKKGRELQVASLLLNNIIKQNVNTHLILDFEGSVLPNLASFFKSFGAHPETYFLLKKRLL